MCITLVEFVGIGGSIGILPALYPIIKLDEGECINLVEFVGGVSRAGGKRVLDDFNPISLLNPY